MWQAYFIIHSPTARGSAIQADDIQYIESELGASELLHRSGKKALTEHIPLFPQIKSKARMSSLGEPRGGIYLSSNPYHPLLDRWRGLVETYGVACMHVCLCVSICSTIFSTMGCTRQHRCLFLTPVIQKERKSQQVAVIGGWGCWAFLE